MKQKTDDNDLVTKGYFRQELKIFQEEFHDEIAGLIDRSEKRTSKKIDASIDKSEGKMKKYINDNVINKLDFIVGELETIREEQTIANQHFVDLKTEVNEHDGRLTKLEKTVKN